MESLRACSGLQMLGVYKHEFGSTDMEVDIKSKMSFWLYSKILCS